MAKNNSDNFYNNVSGYYDQDADMGFVARAEANPLLERIRNDFRTITIKYPFKNALEIGCGPGFDVAWFAAEFPERLITGLDISANMVSLAQEKISSLKLTNATVFQSDERSLTDKFKHGQFDLIFVYFGALNTVSDLDYAAKQIHDLLKPGGHAVLTFVNKWYLREMTVQAIKLNFKTAFARLKKKWGGYSIDRHLPSHCYSQGEIKKAFSDFKLLERKGYSIFFPAWYNYKKIAGNQQKADKLWERDQKLQKTCFWSKGEYLLFVFRKSL